MRTLRQTASGRGPGFTSRQEQVVRLLAAGCTDGEIARHLAIGRRSARSSCDVLRIKLRVRHRRQIPAAFYSATGINLYASGATGASAQVSGGASGDWKRHQQSDGPGEMTAQAYRWEIPSD